MRLRETGGRPLGFPDRQVRFEIVEAIAEIEGSDTVLKIK